MKMSKIFQKTLLVNLVLFGVISFAMSVMFALTLYNHMIYEYISKGKAIASSIASSSVEIILNSDAATVQSMIDQFLEIDGAAYVYVEDDKGNVISHTFVPQIPKKLLHLPHPKNKILVRNMNVEGFGKIIDITKPILAGMAGYVHVGMDKEIITHYVWMAIAKLQILMFFIFWGSVFILYLLVNRISRPLDLLTEYAKKLSVHDFTATVEIKSKDEIGILANTMRSMAEELTTLISGLERSVDNATSELQNTLTYLEVIIDNLTDGLLVIDVFGKISLTNPALAALFGLDQEEIKGKELGQVFSGEMIELFKNVKNCDSGIFSKEIKLADKRTAKAVATAIHERTTDVDCAMCLGAVIMVRDITYEKEVDTLKTDFISTVSHELRTPMTSILGFAKIIKKKLEKNVFPLCETTDRKSERSIVQIQDNIDIIVSEGQRLTDLINDVLDIAKMESGKIEWKNTQISLAEIIKNSIQTTKPLWASKDLEVTCQIDENLPMVSGDHDRLIQVMVNLLSNAVKFTSSGFISCRAAVDGNYIIISVEDSGTGISPADQNKIFDRFKQAGDTLTGKPRGTGLGLPICKQIVEHHEGKIWVESELGNGSTFYFSIPLSEKNEKYEYVDKSSRMRSYARRSNNMSHPLILVADDDPALNEFLSQILEDEGYRVISADNGEEAIQIAEKELPALITMDLKMPRMDGEQAIKVLRENPVTAHIPVIVISALAEGSKVGGDAALIKPIDESRLIETIHSLMQEDLVMTDPCLVLGDKKRAINSSNLLVICKNKIDYCPPEEIWQRIESGFKGTLFIMGELSLTLDLDRLSSTPDVQVVIIPDN